MTFHLEVSDEVIIRSCSSGSNPYHPGPNDAIWAQDMRCYLYILKMSFLGKRKYSTTLHNQYSKDARRKRKYRAQIRVVI